MSTRMPQCCMSDRMSKVGITQLCMAHQDATVLGVYRSLHGYATGCLVGVVYVRSQCMSNRMSKVGITRRNQFVFFCTDVCTDWHKLVKNLSKHDISMWVTRDHRIIERWQEKTSYTRKGTVLKGSVFWCFLLKVPWPFLHKVQNHKNPESVVALLDLSTPTYKP